MIMTEKLAAWPRPFGKVPTEKLVFALKVGRNSLAAGWRGPRLSEVRRHLAEIEKELALRSPVQQIDEPPS